MIALIRNANLLVPGSEKKADILFNDRVIEIGEGLNPKIGDLQVIDAEGKYLSPGLIDQHMHLIGAGGKFGFSSLTPEIMLSDLLMSGLTTVVGTLGTDGATRSVKSLYAKTRSLVDEGISAYMYTNYFGLPPVTITGSVLDDMVFIDRVLGCKIAISDERSSYPTDKQLLDVLHDVRIGGLVSGKGGIMHVHLGALETRIQPLLDLVEKYKFPIRNISPTHVGRTEKLFYHSLEFAKLGGMIDITTGASKFTDPSEQVLLALKEGVSIDLLTFSSDSHAGLSVVNEEGQLIRLKKAPMTENFGQVRELIATGKVAPAEALKLITLNPAKNLGLKQKGRLATDLDADFTLYNSEFEITDVIARGKLIMQDRKLLKTGSYEE